MNDSTQSFTLDASFSQSEDRPSGLSFGPLESQYQELFAEVLEDGVITPEERQRLEKVAANLGLDPERLARLEEAMSAAYESHHQRRIVDQSRSVTPETAPFDAPEGSLSPGGPTSIGHVQLLLEENRKLRARVAELEAELEVAKNSVSIEVDLGDLSARPTSSNDPNDLWKLVRGDSANPARHIEYRDACLAAGDADGAYLASAALVALGAGSSEDRARYEEGRPSGLIAPHKSFDRKLWDEVLIHPEEDRVTGAIFGLIAKAVLVGRVTTLRRDGQLHLGRPDAKQDPASSTIMAARAVGWASAILGLQTPTLYIEKERPAAFTLNPGVPPTTLIGKGALSGRSTPELAFLAGRHLTGFRAEHFVKNLFPSPADLEDLFLAALLISNPALPLNPRSRSRVEPLAIAIQPLLERPEHDQLRDFYQRFVEEGGRTNLQRFTLGVDKTAARAGLALSQELPTALKLLAEDEGPTGPLALDLLAFWASPRHRELRTELGLAR